MQSPRSTASHIGAPHAAVGDRSKEARHWQGRWAPRVCAGRQARLSSPPARLCHCAAPRWPPEAVRVFQSQAGAASTNEALSELAAHLQQLRLCRLLLEVVDQLQHIAALVSALQRAGVIPELTLHRTCCTSCRRASASSRLSPFSALSRSLSASLCAACKVKRRQNAHCQGTNRRLAHPASWALTDSPVKQVLEFLTLCLRPARSTQVSRFIGAVLCTGVELAQHLWEMQGRQESQCKCCAGTHAPPHCLHCAYVHPDLAVLAIAGALASCPRNRDYV